jgi:flagellar motor switch protein FliN
MNNMGDMLSQAEIDALLNGTSLSSSESSTGRDDITLTTQEIDALGEIGNISMGTSATTLFTLLGHKVLITTPKVTITSFDDMAREYVMPYVAVKVEYTQGLVGSNLLIMKETDVKIITDLMMGGEGTNTGGELTDLHLSAISEAMNQMVGSSSTSMSSMFDKRIDISPPKAFIIHFDSDEPYSDFERTQKLVKISFKMVVGNLIDSEIMQLLPISFAKNLVDNLLNKDLGSGRVDTTPSPAPRQQPVQQPPQQPGYSQPAAMQYEPQQAPLQQMPFGYGVAPSEYGYVVQEPPGNRAPVNIQPAQFQAFDDGRISVDKKNIGLIMDVPLQVTVELGRTQKLIRDILEFGPGSVIELDKLAGEPVDILINGKAIAKGEVVVIDESFAVRITDIVHPSKRL